jgi:hypothetical protein
VIFRSKSYVEENALETGARATEGGFLDREIYEEHDMPVSAMLTTITIERRRERRSPGGNPSG